MNIDPISLLDLTSLSEDDTPERVRALCARAETPRGTVAAVCVLPAFAAIAAEALAASSVRVAVVADFPHGRGGLSEVVAEVVGAVAAGADEIDVVAPWHVHLDGDAGAIAPLVAACAEAAGGRVLKVILETGSHPHARATREMAEQALTAGATFLKTSTGKHGPGASPEAARVLLEAVRDHGSGGVKVSGGVRTAVQAQAYLDLAAEVMGEGWASPQTLRIGASALLDDLLGDA